MLGSRCTDAYVLPFLRERSPAASFARMERRNWRKELGIIFQNYWECLSIDTPPREGLTGLWEQHYTEPSWQSFSTSGEVSVERTCKLLGCKDVLLLTCRELPAALRLVSRHIQSYVAFDSLLESFLAEFELTNRLPGSGEKRITHGSVIERINSHGLLLISRFLKGISAEDSEFQNECLQKQSELFGRMQACIPYLAQPNVHRVGCNPDARFEVPLPPGATEQKLPDIEQTSSHNGDPRNLVQLVLRGYILDVYWYTMGTKGYGAYSGIGFPCKPRDVLGVLRLPSGDGSRPFLEMLGPHSKIDTTNGSRPRWFYYKDNMPDHYGWCGQTHSEWCYFVGDDLAEVLRQMREEDVIAFARAVYTKQRTQSVPA